MLEDECEEEEKRMDPWDSELGRALRAMKVPTDVLHSETFLDLANRQLKIEDMATLAPALATSTTLTTLFLSQSPIGPNGARHVADAVRNNTTLRKLSMCACGLGDLGARHLAEALKINSALTNLILSSNKIGADGMTALADSLNVNTTLTALILNDSDLNGRHSHWHAAIATALKNNTTLQELSLARCNLDDGAARALAEALRYNTGLKSLSVVGNRFSRSGDAALAESLKDNSTLTCLRVGPLRCAPAILKDAMEINTTIVTLEWSSTEEAAWGFYKEQYDPELDELLRRNRSFRQGVGDTKPARAIPLGPS